MKDPAYVASKLQNHTHADDFSIGVDSGNRYVYTLHFSHKIGYDWLMSVVGTVSSKCGIDLQRWKIEPHENGFSVSVKEVDRRENVKCDEQGTLFEYEQ